MATEQNPIASVENKRARPPLKKFSPEDAFMKMFIEPSANEIEEKMKEQFAEFDKIKEKWKNEEEQRRYELVSKHLPAPLRGSGHDKQQIFKDYTDRILKSVFEEDHEVNETDLDSLISARKDKDISLVSLSCLAASTAMILDYEALHTHVKSIRDDVITWLCRLFRFDGSFGLFHRHPLDGLVSATRHALIWRYERYATEGHACFSKPPVIYISASGAIEFDAIQRHMALCLGLPAKAFKLVPCSKLYASSFKMDCDMLDKMVADDVTAGFVPLLLIAFAGSPVVGEVDNLDRARDTCKKHNLRLHIAGNRLATLCLYSVPDSVLPARTGDSITLQLAEWFGLPNTTPYVTLVKSADTHTVSSPGTSETVGNNFQTTSPSSSNSPSEPHTVPPGPVPISPCLIPSTLPGDQPGDWVELLMGLQVWTGLLSLGHKGIVSAVQNCVDLGKEFADVVDKHSTLRKVNRRKPPPKKEESSRIYSPKELISKAISALILFDISDPVSLFRYVGCSSSTVHNAQSQTTEEATNYLDALNTWLYQSLFNEFSDLTLDIVRVEGEGLCIKFSPLDSVNHDGTNSKTIEQFATALEEELIILDTTLKSHATFESSVTRQMNLRLVQLKDWAGLGAVLYIPDAWLEMTDNLSDNGKREINELNMELVTQLRANDNAFSLGHTENNEACTRFGLITQDTDIEDLVQMVAVTGKHIEEEGQFLERMTSLIKQGIDVANEDLEHENEQKLMEEGALRQMPLVGSLLNWFSPPTASVKGRAFDLKSGKVESTESVYLRKIQIQEDSGLMFASSPIRKHFGTTPISSPNTEFPNDPHDLATSLAESSSPVSPSFPVDGTLSLEQDTHSTHSSTVNGSVAERSTAENSS